MRRSVSFDNDHESLDKPAALDVWVFLAEEPANAKASSFEQEQAEEDERFFLAARASATAWRPRRMAAAPAERGPDDDRSEPTPSTSAVYIGIWNDTCT